MSRSALFSAVMLSAAASISFAAPAGAVPIQPDVRAVYLVPSDRTANPDYVSGITNALLDLQNWYADQLGGSTFRLPSSIVEVVSTPNPSSYYATNPRGTFATDFFFNVVEEGFSLTGGQFNDPDHRWLYYIDADNAPGQLGGAALFGVAELPAQDLRGLAGQEPEPISRWIGGLGHELGHTFGLPHPSACAPVTTAECPNDALMWTGYRTYPDAFLLPEEKTFLLSSPFFGNSVAVPVPAPGTLLLLVPGLAWLGASTRKRPSSQPSNNPPLILQEEQTI